MPELPEVETVVKALNQAVKGRAVVQARQHGKLRAPLDVVRFACVLANREITGIRRRAKYILFDFASENALLAHLGMTGFFHIEKPGTVLSTHDRITLTLDNGDELRFADARRFGFVRLVTLAGPEAMPLELAELGPEPLSRAFTGKVMLERARNRKCPVKVFIMDQTVVVGVGNIYASEALFLAGIDPRRHAGTLDGAEWTRLVAAVKAVLRSAVRKGGSTIKNYRTVDGSEGGFQQTLKVYGKRDETCPICGCEVETIRLGGRSTFFCPDCQR